MNTANTRTVAPATQTVAADGRKLVFLFVDDPEEAHAHAELLESFGYAVRVSKDPGGVSGGALMFRPSALVISNREAHNIDTTLTALRRLHDEGRLTCPILFIGEREDLAQRREALRGGAEAFLARPVNPMELVDALDRITVPANATHLRVMIVDDSHVSARHHAEILEQAGMTVFIVTEPLTVLRPLREFRPDLILMDLHMPDINGQELAALIRQERSYHSIPIVYLSAESDGERQFAALRHGGDDFLEKPIAADKLVRSVVVRARRFHELAAMISRDSLTGLLNHTATKERLAAMMAHTQDESIPLSFAIFDIDHFKSVNDTYGHPIGDLVLKALSRLMKQRLRMGEALGRLGGEEFAAILPGASADEARKRLDDVREEFASLHHSAGETVFSVSFSVGVAEANAQDSIASLSDAADGALYAAKRSGRNRIEIAKRG